MEYKRKKENRKRHKAIGNQVTLVGTRRRKKTKNKKQKQK
jgi:hypothetical protein